MIRVAIADDSVFTCRLIASYLEGAGDCEVVGMAHDAATTLELVRRRRPDVLTLDLEMPGGHGLTLLRQAVEETQVRVVVISGVTRRAAATTLRALEAGAIEFVMKYTPGAPLRPDGLAREIVAKVRVASSSFPCPAAVDPPPPEIPRARHGTVPRRGRTDAEVIVIGASTGGPRAVRDLLAQLPSDFATPCVVVQHMPAVFTGVLAVELSRHVQLPVVEARSGDRLQPGRIVLAPGAQHLLVRPRGALELRAPSEAELHRPCIDWTMVSAAEEYGPSALGVVLTGMGRDGAEGLRRIRERGGEGFVQDPASCVVASMPARALERAGADCVATPERIGHILAARRNP